jgi:hypothetical protein
MDLEKRKRMAAESILENESLRHGLEEDGAAVLLEWGTACAEQIAAATAELEDEDEAEESAYPRLRALRGLLSSIQQLASSDDPSQQEELLNELASHAALIYHHPPEIAVAQTSAARTALQTGNTGEKIRNLRAILEPKSI